jgi:antitoxin CptB
MRELDELLARFVEAHAATMSTTEIDRFEAILDLPDPTLSSYLLGRDAPPDAVTASLVERIRSSLDP